MAKQLQLRKGTATEHNTFTGANGEVTVDTTNKTLRVHDGSTVGGTMLATITGGLVPAAQLPAATTSTQGAVILNNTLTSASVTEALTAAQGKVLNDQAFGVGQEWIDLTSQRSIGINYENNTGRTIFVSVVFGAPSLEGVVYYLILTTPSNQEVIVGLTSPIPRGYKYRLYLAGTISINKWAELR